MSDQPAFAARLIAWQKDHGRQDLPWQGSTDPYRIWVAEIMLQQTQVASVIPYYQRFLAAFPQLEALAAAPLEQVLAHWAGLGYYGRARNLHRAAQQILAQSAGRFPDDFAGLLALPGVGRSTAAAIAAAAFGERQAILDGNVKRVLSRSFAIEGYPGDSAVEKALWQLAESLLPQDENACYAQALMDLGATICTPRRPACAKCPLADTCRARALDRVAELPWPRPRRALPTKECLVPVLIAEAHVLLEHRPPRGLWGGLWSLPEFSGQAALDSYLATLPGAFVRARRTLPPLRHGFTHFRLLLRPELCELDRRPQLVQEPGRDWQAFSALSKLALPTPVARILREHLPGAWGKPE